MRRIPVAMVVVLVLAGCTATSQVSQIDKLSGRGDASSARILLVDPDIKFYVLTAGGVPEPQPDWTDTAERNFLNAARSETELRGANIQIMDESIIDESLVAYEKLHQAVGVTILDHHLGQYKLPSKGEKFDLSLGPGVSVLKDRYGADYAMFVFYRDYRSSGGRMALAIFAAAVGVGVATGGQGGFASLVDLNTGDVVWFNRVSVGTGDLREPEGAKNTVGVLLGSMPRG